MWDTPHLPCSERQIPEDHRDYRITKHSELEGTHKDQWVQLWNERSIQGLNPQSWSYQHPALTNWATLSVTLSNGTTAWQCFQPSREILHSYTSHRTTSLPCPAGRRRAGDAECSLQCCWLELRGPEGKWPLLHPWASLHRHRAVQGLTKAEIKSRLSA